MKGFFVTGTDTEIGKTYVTCLLMQHLAGEGHKVFGLKPIASGCEETSMGLRSEDALAISEYASLGGIPYLLINRYQFAPAIAPHIAAEQAGTEISFDLIQQDVQEASQYADYLFVEGVGGWQVPLGKDGTVSDLAAKLGLDVILVVGIKLGCINHALLTAQDIQRRGLTLTGWIANRCDPEVEASDETIETLKQHIDAPLIADIGFKSHSLDPKISFAD